MSEFVWNIFQTIYCSSFFPQIYLEIFPNQSSPASAVKGDSQQPASTPSKLTAERTADIKCLLKQMLIPSYSSPAAHCPQCPAYISHPVSKPKNMLSTTTTTSRSCLMKEPGLKTAFQNIIKMYVNMM